MIFFKFDLLGSIGKDVITLNMEAKLGLTWFRNQLKLPNVLMNSPKGIQSNLKRQNARIKINNGKTQYSTNIHIYT